VNPLALILLLPLALLALGRRLGVYPRAPAVWLATVPAVLAVPLAVGIRFLPPLAAVEATLSPYVDLLAVILIGLDLLLILILAADLISLPSGSVFSAEREMQRVASLQTAHPVKLTVSNRSQRNVEVEVRDDFPDEAEVDHEEFRIALPPRSRRAVTYQLLAQRRGAFNLERVYLRFTSALRFWQKTCQLPVESLLHVYPDMRQMREYAMLARMDRLNLVGLRRTRRIGQDNEFERLRDYTLDDNYKHIDWRTTARRGKLTVKDFQSNQSQRVIFLIDCGRMMTNTSGGISLLDHSLNAALMLSYVALNKGDAAGLICFADEVQAFVPPRGGMNQMNRLLHASFDRFPRLVESRYDEAFVYLNARCRKRSLVVLITNVIDEVNAQQIDSYLSRLTGRHLPLAVLLRDHAIFDAAENPPGPLQDVAARDILNWRSGVLRDMESRGVLSLDVFPEQMTAPLVNRYLEVKARHLL
jgi:uncharacterized protein (DUF58 family)